MKKLLFTIAITIIAFTTSYAQPINYVVASPFDNSTTQVRAPNGLSSQAYMRAAQLVLATELTGIAPSSTLSSFGFTMNPGTNTAVAGTFTVYLQNTTDITYNKGTTWSSIISGMTTVYASTMTLPATGATSITVTLSTPFVYTGGGIYVAYDWYSAGPFSTTPITYRANSTGLISGCATAASAASAPTTLGASSFRPNIVWGVVNTYTNEIQVAGIEAMGTLATALGTTNIIKGIIRNGSGIANTNITVNLNVTGANTFTNSQIIPSLASGATATISFASFNPTNLGLNNINVSVPTDENNTNNSSVYTQSVTCTTWAMNPSVASYTQGSIGFNTTEGILTSSYLNQATSNIDGLKIGISTGTTSIGNPMWGVLLDATGTILATTNTITIANGDLGTTKFFNFASSQPLTANTNYFLGVAQPSASVGYFPVGSYTAMAYVPYLNYGTSSITGGPIAPLASSLGYFDLEGVFKSNVLVSISNGTICEGQSFNLAPSGASTYTYSSGSAVVSPTVFTSYTVNGSDANGCISANTATADITVNLVPSITVNSGVICAGQSFTMIPSGASTYTYSSGSAVVSPATNATYNITGTSVNGCTSLVAAVSSVTVNALPTVMATTSNTLLCSGQTASLTAMGAVSYTWNTSATNSVIAVTPTTTVTYTVNGVDANGCANLSTITQSVSACTDMQSTINSQQSFQLYPNPSNGSFTIELASDAIVSITNALGQVVMNTTMIAGTNHVALNDVTEGIYFVKVITGNTQTIKRLVVSK